tara:strand:- start:444 stop:1394 length:951 start_codon:yes stop_codon:yes gene_type:complete
MKKILITGGCGFIGSNLTSYLINKRYKVYIIDNFSKNKVIKPHHNSKVYKINIKNINQLDKINNIYAIIHLAASADILISKKNEKKYFEDNIAGLQSVLNFCSIKKINKFIFASSASVYGDTKNMRVKENFKLKPNHYYGYSKYIGEKMIQNYSKINKFNYTILRFFNIYGSKSDAVISTFLAQKIQNKLITIFGNGNQKRDFLYVDDLCSAIAKVLKNDNSNNKIYNLGSGKALSINQIFKKLNYKKKIHLDKRNDDIEISISNINKIKKELNWKPKIDINKGLKQAFAKDTDRLKKISILPISKLKKLIIEFNK